MTLSFANCWCGGGTIVKLDGGPLRRADPGGLSLLEFRSPRAEAGPSSLSLPLLPSSPGLACRFSRDSIIERCWSRTDILLCSCSRMAGSWVENPGERHAIPTSCMRPRSVVRTPVRGVFPLVDVELFFASESLGGRCLAVVGGSGEVGSFFTTI